MTLLKRLFMIGIFLCSLFQPLITGVGYAQGVAQEQEEQTLQKVDIVETFVERIADVVEDKVKNEELLERFEEKKEEMHEEIKEQREKIKETTSSTEQEEAVIELKKTVYLKTYSGLTDHDEIDEIVQVEGGQAEQERAQETALESMQTEEIGEDPSYTVMLKTRLSQEQIEKKLAPFIQDTEQLQIEHLFEEDGVVFFELQIDQESLLGEELLGEVQEGDIPDHLLGIEVIKPEILEIGTERRDDFVDRPDEGPIEVASAEENIQVAGLAGEKNSDLRGMEQYKASSYQGGLHTKKKVSVAVIDTGIDYTHQDLKQNISKRIKGYDFVNKDDDPMDDHIHGTHVAGTIGAALDGKGVYGVHTNTDLVALKICTKYGYCPTYAITKAVKYAADKGIDVLNMSLGGRGSIKNNPVCKAISYAVDKGSIVIAAAGNANSPVSQYIPGACPDAITVGAVDKYHKRAKFSNYGPGVDVSAPGVGIVSTIPGNTWRSLDGTSMATPHIAGLASAVLSYNPNINQSQMRALLKKATKKTTSDRGREIGGFVDMPTLMNSLGAKQYSHAYKIPGESGSVTPEQAATIQSYDKEGMQVSTTHVTLKVGETKTVKVSDRSGTVKIGRHHKGYVMLGTPGRGMSGQSKYHSAVSIASDQEENEQEENEGDSNLEESDTNEMTEEEQIALDTGAVDDAWEKEQEIIEEQMNEEEIVLDASEDEIEIAGTKRTVNLQLTGLKPGKNTVYLIDGNGKKLQIQVTTKERVITLQQGSTAKLHMPIWLKATNTNRWIKATQYRPEYVVHHGGWNNRSGQAYYVGGKMLGTYTVHFPVWNTASWKKDDRFGIMQMKVNVVTTRKDSQAKRQEKENAFWMSHDYIKIKVGEEFDIGLDGNGPFQVRRKNGGTIGYIGSRGGTRVANVEEENTDENLELISIKDEFTSNITDEERERFHQTEENLAGTGVVDFGSGTYYKLEEEQFETNPEEETQEGGGLGEKEEDIMIASAGKQGFSIVGLVPGNEMLFVTDTHGRSKNIFIHVEETDFNDYIKAAAGKGAAQLGSRRRSTELYGASWQRLDGFYQSNWRSGFNQRYSTRKTYIKNQRGRRQRAYMRFWRIYSLGNQGTDVTYTFLNTYEQGKDTYRRNERKYMQKMTFSVNKKLKPVKPLSQFVDRYFDVPDHFTANGTIRMTVGETKTVQVGSQGGGYTYRKENDNVGWINGKTQDVKIASTGEKDDGVLLDVGGDINLTVPEDIGEEEVTVEMEAEIAEIGIDVGSDADMTYEENIQETAGDIQIARVHGKPATFVALRPGTSYIHVRYNDGKYEKMKVIILPKVITKDYNDIIHLTSTSDLPIRSMWSKARNWKQLSFIKRPHKRWTRAERHRRLHASSIVGNDVLYAQIYSRVERKMLYLELHTKVSKPPIKTNYQALSMEVGQTVYIRATGGAGTLGIKKSSDILGWIYAPHRNIKVSSVGAGTENNETKQDEEREIQNYTGVLDEGVVIDIDEEKEVMPTQEQLDASPLVDTGTQDSDRSATPMEAGSGSGALEVASGWRMTVPVQALRPGTVYVTVTDEHGQEKTIKVTIRPKVISKKRGENLILDASYYLPIFYAKTGAGTKMNYIKMPENRWSGGKREIDTTHFKPTETVYVRHYNRKERRYQWLELTVKTETLPLKTSTVKIDNLRTGSHVSVDVTGGVLPYKVTQSGDASVYMNHGHGKTTKDNNLHVFALKAGSTVFTITDAQGTKKTVTVYSKVDEKKVKQGDLLTFNGAEGMPITSVGSKNGTHYVYEKNGLRVFVDTEKMEENDTLLIDVHDKVMGTSFTYEVDLLVTPKPKLVGPEGEERYFCGKENEPCSFTGPHIVAYGTEGKYSEKRYTTGPVVCANKTFGDPIRGKTKGCRTKESTSLTVSQHLVSVTAGEVATVNVYGGKPGYHIHKANNNITLSHSTVGSVKIASSGEEDEEKIIMGTVYEEYEELPLDDSGKEVLPPTEEEVQLLDQIVGLEELSEITADNEVGSEEDGLEIAHTGGTPITIVGLVPGKSQITIIDQYKRSVVVNITVKPTTLVKQPGDVVSLYSTKQVPIRLVRLYHKHPQIELSPKSWLHGGVWKIKTNNFKQKETIRTYVYSHREKRYLRMSLDVELKDVAQMSAQQDPILHLSFDGNTKDTSENYEISEQGKISYVAGHDGKGIQLGSSWLSIPNHIGPQITGNMSISFWIKPDSFTGRQNPLSKSFGGEVSITQEPDGKISTYYGLRGVNAHPYAGFKSTHSVKKGEWNHVTMVKNIDTMKRQIYINGQKSERAVPTNFKKAAAGASDLKIGKGYAGLYKGAMDDLRIYNRALSESEVDELREMKSDTIAYNPQLEHLTFPGLGLTLATVKRDAAPKSVLVEYSKGGKEELKTSDKITIALIDEKRGDWKMIYTDSEGKRHEVKRGVSIASVEDDGGVEIANYAGESSICVTGRGAKFYRAYKSSCKQGHETIAWECNDGYEEFPLSEEINDEKIHGETCLKSMPQFNENAKLRYNDIIKMIIDEGREMNGLRNKEIADILMRFVDKNLGSKYEELFLYIHDFVLSELSVPEMTDDFRKKLIESGKKMRDKKKIVGVSSNSVFELYSYFTRKVWPDKGEWDFKNIDVNKGGYGGYANLMLGGKKVKIDDPGNINFGYAGRMGELSLKVIIQGSLYAQYGVDLKIMDSNGNEVKMDTPDNEELDAYNIIRGYLLGVKYSGNDLPITYTNDLYGFDVEKYAESIGLSSVSGEDSSIIYYLTPKMDLKK